MSLKLILDGSLNTGNAMLFSGSGGGTGGGPPKPKLVIKPPSWWQRFVAWLKSKLGK